MTSQSTLPSLKEQAWHALLLLGVPAPARLIVDVHAAFFDGDLSVPALAALMREDERSWRPGASQLICPALTLDLAPARGMVALSAWPLADRLCTPAVARAHSLVATVRIAEFAAVRPGASGCAFDLLRRLSAEVPGGLEAFGAPGGPETAELRANRAAKAAPGDADADALSGGQTQAPVGGQTNASSGGQTNAPSGGQGAARLAEAARAALDDPTLAAAVAAEEPAREEALTRAVTLDERHRLFGVTPLPHQRGGA